MLRDEGRGGDDYLVASSSVDSSGPWMSWDVWCADLREDFRKSSSSRGPAFIWSVGRACFLGKTSGVCQNGVENGWLLSNYLENWTTHKDCSFLTDDIREESIPPPLHFLSSDKNGERRGRGVLFSLCFAEGWKRLAAVPTPPPSEEHVSLNGRVSCLASSHPC